MKKILSLLILAAIAVGSLCLVSCGEKNYEVGVGIHASANATDADGEADGSAEVNYTMAAIIVDADGKLVGCKLDSTYYGVVTVSADGDCEIARAMTTKRALGKDYGMSAAGFKEWYEQTDAFASVAVGKTLDEVKALVGPDYKGTEDVVNAGCSIYVSDFAVAIEKAFANKKAFSAKDVSADSVNIGVSASSSCISADGEEKGSATFVATVTASVKSGDKIVCCITDELEAKLEITADGAVTGADAALKSKRALGDSYGMAGNAYAPDLNGDGKVLEWYLQVDAFDAACEGKGADEIAALSLSDGSGYATEDVQTAGCTINVAGFVKSAIAAAK